MKRTIGRAAELSAFIFLAMVSLFFFLAKISLSGYGLDFTDEGYYLVTISDPFEYPATVTQFGFLLHPIYELLNGDISLFRSLNIAATFLLSFALTIITLKYLFRDSIAIKARLLMAFCLAVTSMLVFHVWKVTPNYNSLTYQAMLITMIGLLWVSESDVKVSFFGAVIVGVGGWLAFMAKPTTALILGFAVVLCLIVAGNFRIKWLAQAALTSVICLVVSAILIDGSVSGFITRLVDGVSIVSAIGHEKHGLVQLFRIDWFRADLSFAYTMLGVITVGLFVEWLVMVKKPVVNDWGLSILIIVIGIFFLCLIAIVDPKLILGATRFPLLIVVVPILAILLIVFAVLMKPGSFLFQRINRQHLGLMLAFLFMPYAFAFGTGTNYWNKYPSVALFWILGILVLFVGFEYGRKLLNQLSLLVVFASVMIAAFMFNAGVKYPQREPVNLNQNNLTVQVGVNQAELILNKEVGFYLKQVINSARLTGCCENTSILDFTGQSPGLIFALGAKAPGIAWMIGGYPGSRLLAESTLQKIDCAQLVSAWLLTEPEGPRSIPTELLIKSGTDSRLDYQIVGEFVVPFELGARKYSQKQYLLKPARELSSAVRACEQARENRS